MASGHAKLAKWNKNKMCVGSIVVAVSCTHCYSIRLNLKKMGPLQFCLQVCLGIHRNPKQKKNHARVKSAILAMLVRPTRIPHRISEILFALGADEFLAMLEGKIREAPFF